jgi:hypothetical protein
LTSRLTVGRGITQSAQENVATWLGKTLSGRSIAPGVYTIVVRSSFGTKVTRMTIVK